jgi:hypothetical protein
MRPSKTRVCSEQTRYGVRVCSEQARYGVRVCSVQARYGVRVCSEQAGYGHVTPSARHITGPGRLDPGHAPSPTGPSRHGPCTACRVARSVYLFCISALYGVAAAPPRVPAPASISREQSPRHGPPAPVPRAANPRVVPVGSESARPARASLQHAARVV